MDDAVSMPTTAELRTASAQMQVAAVLGAHPLALAGLREAARRQSYFVETRAMGVSDTEAARVLQEADDEISALLVAGAPMRDWDGNAPDVCRIARNRLAEGGDAYRPSAEWRDAARGVLAAGGYSLHPEFVDQKARELQHLLT